MQQQPGRPGARDYVKELFSAVALSRLPPSPMLRRTGRRPAGGTLEWPLPFVSGPERPDYSCTLASHIALSKGNFGKKQKWVERTIKVEQGIHSARADALAGQAGSRSHHDGRPGAMGQCQDAPAWVFDSTMIFQERPKRSRTMP